MNTVSFKIKRRSSKKKGKPMLLDVQIIYLRDKSNIMLPYPVSEYEWDTTKAEIVIPDNADKYREEELRDFREKIKRDLRIIMTEAIRLAKKGAPSVKDISNACRKRLEVSDFGIYAEKLIAETKSRGKLSTASNYQSTLNSFMEYRSNVDIRLDDIDTTIVKEYETFLYESKICSHTVSFYLSTLRAIRNHAVKEGFAEPSPALFKDVYTGTDKTDKRAINEDVLSQLIVLDLSLSYDLALARDLFLFCYYARGMSFIDLAHLKKDNIKGKKLVYIRKKTGQKLTVKLLPEMKQLIARYRKVSGPYLFPVLKNGNASYRDYTSALRLQNMRLKKLGKLVGADLSTHVARHTWASIALKRGISEELISRGMGHFSVTTTRIYLIRWDDDQLDRANEIVVHGKKCLKKTASNKPQKANSVS